MIIRVEPIRRRIRRVVAVLTLAGLVAAGCGDGSSDVATEADGSGDVDPQEPDPATTGSTQTTSPLTTSPLVGEPSDLASLPDYLAGQSSVGVELALLRQPLFVPAGEPVLPSAVDPVLVVTSFMNYRLKWANQVGPGHWSVSVVGRDAEVDPAFGEFVYEDASTGLRYLVDGDPEQCEPIEDIGIPGGVWQWEVDHGDGVVRLGVEVNPAPACEGAPLTIDEIVDLIRSIRPAYDPGKVDERVVAVDVGHPVVAGVEVAVVDVSERIPGSSVTLSLTGLEAGIEVGAAICPADTDPTPQACASGSSAVTVDDAGRALVSVIAVYVLRTDLTIQEAGTGERSSADIDCISQRACEIVVADRSGTVLAVVPYTA